MSLVENITRFFKAKAENRQTESAPEGVCPNCWGEQEWEGEFYKHLKANTITPESDRYNNWIKEFVVKHIDGIAIDKDTHVCISCKVNYTK